MPTSSRVSPSIATALALGLALLLISGILAALPAWAAPLTPAPATPILGFTESQQVSTGLGNGQAVYNGDNITYVLALSNTGNLVITDVVLLDFLPDIVQDIHVLSENTITVTCSASSTWELARTSKVFPGLGGLNAITVTDWITWTVPNLPPGASTLLTISGRVEGQADGSVFVNRAYVRFNQGGQPQTYNFKEVTTTARLRVSSDGNIVSQTPNWFSNDLGGTLSQDWGDFDRDGYLDLVLGSLLGPTIYRNDNGRLAKFKGPASTRPAYGVRWADVNDDGQLELIAVGDSADDTPSGTGLNRVYTNLNGVFSETNVFRSDSQLVRVIAVNLNPLTRTIDLIASTNSINAPCPVQRFRNDTFGHFTPAECLSTAATAALSAGDFNNDGWPDLVLGRFPDAVRLLINHAGILTETNWVTQTNSVIFDTASFLPYDFAWGDYDGDGYLDLAAAFPMQRQARIYHNTGGTASSPFQLSGLIATKRFMTPLAVDWGEFSGNGRLNLLVADDPPKVYLEPGDTFGAHSAAFSAGSKRTDGGHDAVWSARAVALDNRSLSLALSNQTGASLIYQTQPAHLSPTLTAIDGAAAANSVAWGDANGDGLPDLIMGAGAENVPSRLYLNNRGLFSIADMQSFFPSGFGPHSTAYGDLNGDGQLEAVIGTGYSRFIDTYQVSTTLKRAASILAPVPVNVVALGDANDDGFLDLLVGTSNGLTLLYTNTQGTLGTTPIWMSAPMTGPVSSVAWTDIDGDRYMDFAVGHNPGSVIIYRNNRNKTFTPVFTSKLISHTTGVAWGDYNRDGFPDLAVGTYGEGNLIYDLTYDNVTNKFTITPTWISSLLSPTLLNKTTSVAWGDWNNDDYLDLAVGNDGEPNQVYANLNSEPGVLRLFQTWQSAETGATTGVAWGDVNHDGYLDLAVSRKSGPLGVYHNVSIVPSHLTDVFTPTQLLPWQPSYVSIARPGVTRDAYLYSSSELLSGRFAPTVTIRYLIYNPNGTRLSAGSNVAGTPITNTRFEYSVDGGSNWYPASPAISNPLPITQTTRLGAPGIFVWDAQKDAQKDGARAISDNALFRVRVVDVSPVGPVQRASGVAVSPPFRVRGLTCVWPANPNFVTVPSPVVSTRKTITFTGTIDEGTGPITYTWDFGDGKTSPGKVITQGQVVTHVFASEKVYTVTLTVTGEPCPIIRPVTVTRRIGLRTYLPIMHMTKLPKSAALAAPAPIGALWQSVLDLIQASAVGPTAPTASNDPTFINLSPGITSALTTSPLGYNIQPALNFTGTRVAYLSTANVVGTDNHRNPDGNLELFVASINSATGKVTYTQITSSTGSILGGFNLGPSIDRTGNRIAFFSDRDLTGDNPDLNFEIFLAQINDAYTVTLTQLTNTRDGINSFPSISADGSRVAFTSDRDLTGDNPDLNPEIFIVKLNGEGQPDGCTQVTFTAAQGADYVFNDQPAFDDDGSHLTFISDAANAFGNGANPDRVQEVFMADVRTPGAIVYTRVTTSAAGLVNEQPMISPSDPSNPDSTDYIVSFMAGDNISRSVQAVRVGATGAISPIPVPGTGREQPALNRNDGTRLVVVSSDGTQVEVLDTFKPGLDATHVVSATGSSNTVPAISPDGMHIAYVSDRQIYVVYYPVAIVLIGKEVTPQSVSPQTDLQRSVLTYTIRLTNTSATTAPAVVISDTLSDQLQALAAPRDQTDGDGDGNDSLDFSDGWLDRNGVTLTNRYLTMTTDYQLPDLNASWFDMTRTVLLFPFYLTSTAPFPDVSNSGHDGYCNVITCPTMVPSALGGAAAFSGTQNILVSNPDGLDFDRNTGFTLMGWFDLSSGWQGMLGKYSSAGYILYQSGGRPAIQVNNTTVIGEPLSGRHHLAAVVDRSTSTLALYVDGLYVAGKTFRGATYNSAALTLGQWGGNFYTGNMDDVAILSRALTATELKMIYDWQTQTFFDSRLMDGYYSTIWNRLSWSTIRPIDKELPGNASTSELSPTYQTGGADMSNNILLLHLNENGRPFADSSGRALPGTCSDPLCPSATTGRFNGGLRFDASQVVTLNSSTIISPLWTVELWVYRQDSPNAAAVLLDGPQTSLRLEQNGRPNVGVTQYGGSDPFFNYIAPLNQWTHLAFVAEGLTLTLYADGVAKGALTNWTGSLPLGTLGGRAGGADGMKGVLDEVAAYAGALPSAEIYDHYLRGKLRLKFQVRSCNSDDPNPKTCPVSTPFLGPNGQLDTFYREPANPTSLTSTLAITVPAQRYFQYRAYFERDDQIFDAPTLRSVTVGPPHIQVFASQGNCTGARVIRCELGDLAPNNMTATVELVTKLEIGIGKTGSINNTAALETLAVNHADQHAASVSAKIDAGYDLSITVSTFPESFIAGRPVTYTFVVTNAGPNNQDNVIVSDTLPSGLKLDSITGELESSTGKSAVTCYRDVVQCVAATLPAGEGNRFIVTVVAIVHEDQRDSIVNMGETFVQDLSDNNQDNDRVTITSTVSGEADLALTKTVALNSVAAGQLLTYTLVVTNSGPSSANEVIITDSLPFGLIFTTTGSSQECHGAANVVCKIGSMAVTDARAVTLVTLVLPNTRGQIVNSALVAGLESDPAGGNNTVTDVATTVTARTNLNITKAGMPTDAVTLGEVLTYTLGVTNTTGPSSAQTVIVTDVLPRGVSVNSIKSTADKLDEPACLTESITVTPTADPRRAYPTTQVRCNLGTLHPIGDPVLNNPHSAFVTVIVTVTNSAGSTIANTAAVTATETPAVMTSNFVTHNVSGTLANLTITKSAEPLTEVTPGRAVTYTLTITNEGPFSAYNVSVTDTLPAGLTFMGEIRPPEIFSRTSPVGNPIVWTAPFLDVNEHTTIVFSATIASSLTGASIANHAAVTARTPDLNPAGNTATRTSPITTSADLAIGKLGSASVVAGEHLTYTLFVTNTGPSDAWTVKITDTLPISLTYAGPVSNNLGLGVPTITERNITWTMGTLAAGDNGVIVFTANVDPAFTGSSVVNLAGITSNTFDPGGDNNTAQAPSTVTTSADLGITKQGAQVPVVAGTAMTYTLHVNNDGPSGARNVVITDTLPDSLIYGGVVSSLPALSPPTVTGQTITWPTWTLAARANGEIVFTATVKSDFTGSSLVNSAGVTSSIPDPNPAGNVVTRTSDITASADLVMTKQGWPALVVAGTSLTYTLFITNIGPSDAVNVHITDTLPVSLTYGGTVSPLGLTAITNGQNITWTMGTLDSGASASIVFTATVDKAFTGSSITNRAGITSDTPDSNPASNTAPATSNVTTSANLAIGKQGPSAPVVAGTSLTYTLFVTNTGSSDAQNVEITDTLPISVAFGRMVTSTPALALSAPISNGQTIMWTTGAMAAGASGSIVFTATVDSAFTKSLITNTAGITSSTPDPNPAGNVVTRTSDITTSADLVISKRGSSAPVVAGTSLTYTLFVTNTGPSDAVNVRITDTLPVSLTYGGVVSSIPTLAPPITTGQTITWTVGPLTSGASASIMFTAAVDPAFHGSSVVNTAGVTSNTPDPKPASNTAQAPSDVTASADLGIAIERPVTVVAGTSLTYTLFVTNTGLSDAQGVSITDTLPISVAFGRMVTSTPALALSAPISTGRNITWTTGTMAVGASGSIVFTATVDSACTKSSITNTAGITSNTTDPNPANNSRASTTAVTVEANLQILKDTTSNAPAIAGDPLTYVFTVTNSGPSQATNVTVTDNLTTVLPFQSSPSGCDRLHGSNVIKCTAPTLGALGQKTFMIVVIPDGNLDAGTVITNTADVTATGAISDASGSKPITIATLVNLAVGKQGPPSVVAGAVMTYTLFVTNTGPSDAQTVDVTDILSEGLTYLSSTSVPPVDKDPNDPPNNRWRWNWLGVRTGTITFTVQVDNNLQHGAKIPNKATVVYKSGQITSSETVTTTVTGRADLGLTKIDEISDVIAGQNLTYTFNVTNSGPVPATSVIITDDLSGGLTFVSGSPGCSSASASVVTCTLSTPVPVTATYTITLVTRVKPDWRDPITNTARIGGVQFDPYPANNIVTSTPANVTAKANFTVTKTGTPAGPFDLGGELTYIIGITNTGPSSAQFVTVTDVLSSGVSLKSVTPPGGTTCTHTPITGMLTEGGSSRTYTDTQVVCNLGALNPEGYGVSSAFVTLVVTVSSQAGSTITNAATVTATVMATGAPVIVTSNLVTHNVSASANLTITKSATPDPVTAGRAVTYTLTMTNVGSFSAYHVTVTDTLPASLTFKGEIAPSTIFSLTSSTDHAITWTAPFLDAGEHTSIVFSATVDSALIGPSIINTAGITSSTPDSNKIDNFAWATSAITTSADLGITNTGVFVAGTSTTSSTITYTLVITNGGPSSAAFVTVTDMLSNVLTYITHTTSGPSLICEPRAGVNLFGCAVDTLAFNDRYTITLVTGVVSGTIGRITNTAIITSTTRDPFPTNNRVTITTPATSLASLEAPAVASGDTLSSGQAGADLSLSKIHSTEPVTAGDVLTYTLTYHNAGPTEAANVLITDTLPLSLTYGGVVSTDPVLEMPILTEQNVTWDAGTVAAGAGGSIVFTATVNGAPTGGRLLNLATIGSTTGDPDISNNTASDEAAIALVRSLLRRYLVLGQTVLGRLVSWSMG
jgi:uncharacterized repeat protein (TIGR01451 family)